MSNLDATHVTSFCYGDDEAIWVTRRERDTAPWGPPQNLGATLNSSAGEFAPAFDASGHVLFFGSERTEGCGGRDLWFSTSRNKRDRDVWAAMRNSAGGFDPPLNVSELNSPSVDARPAVRRDGLEFFLSSNRPGSIEGSAGPSNDIWSATRGTTAGTWSVPVNLELLNTSFNDGAPALSKDKATPYFNSNRPGGSGGMDLYASTRSK
jgi:peptidoglycan-associated lipoprotein